MTSRRLFRLSYLDRREELAPQKRTVSVCTLHFDTFVDDTRELDTQLRILQSVAAHMKLLLDTPEHIWRLLEKKKYLHAGWLFLLARIIYQALVRMDTEDEEDDWRAQGIDVLVCSAIYCSSVQVLTVCHRCNSLLFNGNGTPFPSFERKLPTKLLYLFVIPGHR